MKHATCLLLLVVLLVSCAPKPIYIPYKDPGQPVEERLEDLLSRMTLEEKIGQMTQVENNSITPYYLFPPAEVAKYFIGSVLSGGNGSGFYTLADWTGVAKSYEVEAVTTRLGIPLIFGVDSVHGFGHVNGATIFPHNIGLGATRDPELVRQIGQVTAEEMLAAGIPWNFAPVVAVPQDIRWGRTYEGFSEDTTLVTELSSAYIQGFQTVPKGYASSVGQTLYALATPKHFIGDGGTTWGSIHQYMFHQYMLDQGDTLVNEATLRRLFLPPYQAAVNSGAMSVMVSFSSWNGVKMHAQRYLLTEVLKGELGFRGFIVSDWGGINQVDPDYYKAVVTAINAGIDMNMVPAYYQMFIGIMKQAVMNGDITQERIDDAVRRILRAKFMLGLFENPYGDPGMAVTVGSEEHRALAREAVRESLVLLKNDNRALPIDKNASTILVAGINSTGIQAGGWTLDWQGEQRNVLAGKTILEGIQELVGSNTQVLYNSWAQFASFNGKAPVGIAIVGEMPYAEGLGDRADLSLYKVDQLVIDALRLQVDKLIVVILSGRPLVITDQYQTADAWVAAWLPGSEGEGVADVLFGDHPFVGKLPYTWPRSNDQLPLNINNSANLTGCAAPLFPLGYGLGAAGSQPIEWLNCEK
jgi:beta-glucosidase